jgi:hypothetical protein
LTVTWDEFIRRFDQRFISSAARAGKEAELFRLKQGDSSVAAYEDRFASLCRFTGNIFQTEERMARMFMRGLCPHIRRRLESQSFNTLREVVIAALDQEIEMSVIKDKGKEKRPIGAFEQQGSQQRGPTASGFVGSCYNCRKRGHKSVEFRLTRTGPDSPRSYFSPLQQACAYHSVFFSRSPPQQAQAHSQYSEFTLGSGGPDGQGQDQYQQQQQGGFQPHQSFQASCWEVVQIEEPESP